MSAKKVKKIVVLMRHGIRAPNQTMEKLAEWSHRRWPIWPVPPGFLTGRGRELMVAFWRQYELYEPYRSLLGEEGHCLSPDDIFIHADIDERTQTSAAAFASAISPACPPPYFVTTDKKIDSVFHPVSGTICNASRKKDESDIVTIVETSFSKLADEFSPQLEFVTELLGAMPQGTCKEYGIEESCELRDLPPRVNFANSGRTVNLRGALGIKATLIQNWLLESAQWPDRFPGWGEITPDILSQLLVARAAIFNSLNRAAPYARDRGSAILSAMADSLLGRHFDPHANNAKCVVYMGHDTNIAHVAELLGLEWDLENFAYNDIPPASFVQFILWEKQTGEEVITAEFVAQPLEVMHSVCPENIHAGVIVKQLEFNPAPSERLDSSAFEYSKEKFAEVVSEVINQDCIPHARALKKGTMK